MRSAPNCAVAHVRQSGPSAAVHVALIPLGDAFTQWRAVTTRFGAMSAPEQVRLQSPMVPPQTPTAKVCVLSSVPPWMVADVAAACSVAALVVGEALEQAAARARSANAPREDRGRRCVKGVGKVLNLARRTRAATWA